MSAQENREREIGKTDTQRKVYSWMLIVMMAGLVLFTMISNVRVGVQIYNDTETTEHIQREKSKAEAALHVYMDSVQRKNVTIGGLKKKFDSVTTLHDNDRRRIEDLERKNKVLSDSIRAKRKVRVSTLQPDGN